MSKSMHEPAETLAKAGCRVAIITHVSKIRQLLDELTGADHVTRANGKEMARYRPGGWVRIVAPGRAHERWTADYALVDPDAGAIPWDEVTAIVGSVLIYQPERRGWSAFWDSLIEPDEAGSA